MSTKGRDISVRRILLPLDSSALSRRTLEIAADLAGTFEAELVGLFVKEANLLNLAELPFTRVIDRRSGERRELSRGGMEQALDALSEKARAMLGELARQRSIAWSFEIRTGEPLETAVAESGQFDLVAVGSGMCASARAALSPQAKGQAMRAGSSLFLLERDPQREQPVFAFYEGSSAVLAAAMRLAAALNSPLQILALDSSQERAKKRQRNARAWLTRRNAAARIDAIATDDADDLIAALAQSAPAAAVIERQADLSSQFLESEDLPSLQIPLFVLG